MLKRKKSEQGRHQLVLVIDMSQCSEPMVFTDKTLANRHRNTKFVKVFFRETDA